MGRDPNPDRPRVLGEWEAAFGSPPPQYLSVGFMQKAISYERQCKAAGGVPATIRKALKQIANGKPAKELSARTTRPGTHLVREWNGRSYQVEVIEGGFRMDGKEWTSLSAIAKHITGTGWSGPRFFGLATKTGGGQ